MKSSIISMLYACSASTKNSPLLVFNNDEETDSEGINLVLDHFKDMRCCIVGEPTELMINPAHRGRAVYMLTMTGDTMHASYSPHNNLIYRMCEVLKKIKEYTCKEHAFLGRETLTPVTLKTYPEALNVTPGDVRMYFDRRKCIPVKDYAEDLENIKNYLNLSSDMCIGLDPEKKNHTLPYECKDKTFIKMVQKVLTESGKSDILKPFTATCDASFIGKYVPTVILGPGSLSEAHTPEEKIRISDIIESCEIYTRLNTEVKNGL